MLSLFAVNIGWCCLLFLRISSFPKFVLLYYVFQLYFVMTFCGGGAFFRALQRQPKKRHTEDAARFYAGEVCLVLRRAGRRGCNVQLRKDVEGM